MNPKIRTYTLPVAMTAGILMHRSMAELYFLTPYIIFGMLFIPFTCISPSDVRPKRSQFLLLLIQLLISVSVYFLLRSFNEIVAEGVMICIYAPAAMASATIGRMLGGDLKTMTAFILLSNVGTAIATPFLFTWMGVHGETSFWNSFLLIFNKVAVVLMLPLATAWLLRWSLPKVHDYVARHQDVSFYIWAFSLLILIGKTTDDILMEPSHNIILESFLAAAGLAICLLQFFLGHRIGLHSGDTVAATQSLGQKNTTLAIWLTLTYLNPLAAVAPTSYIVWQNIINSWQLWKKRKDEIE